MGVASGTMLGVILDVRLSTGQSAVRIVADGEAEELANTLRGEGWAVTRMPGEGVRGPIGLLLVLVDDRQLPAITAALHTYASDAFWYVERVQQVKTLPFEGYHPVARSRR